MKRRQNGCILAHGDHWYLKFYEDRNVEGVITRRRVCKQIAEKTTRGKTPPENVLREAERVMNRVNNCAVEAQNVVSVVHFVERVFLPTAEKRLRSYRNYQGEWDRRLRRLLSRERMNMKDVRCVHVQSWLEEIGRDGELSKSSLKGIKSMLSGVFKEAKRLGYYDGVNPVQDTRVPDAREPEETYAYSLEEITTILGQLPEPAATIFAVAAFSGLRRSEIEGLRWEDYSDGDLHVTQSIVMGKVTRPKSRASRSAVPVIKPLADRLEMHRLRSSDAHDGWIFSTSCSTPLSLHNVVNRQILPALAAAGIEWHGFHACRRGLASNLYRLGVSDLIIQRILRHSNVSVTQRCYIKTSSPDARAAMDKLEASLVNEWSTDTESERATHRVN